MNGVDEVKLGVDDQEIAKLNALHAQKIDEKKMEGGYMGKIFGFSTEKPGNIAAFVLIVAFLLLACILLFGTDTQSISKKDEFTIVVGVITLALGFVFGRTTST
jgi:glycerol uptake facilitator-like aquaporin